MNFIQARNYWKYLTNEDLRFYWKHYTVGEGRGMYSSVGPETSFEDYVINSAQETEGERIHNA